MAGRSRITSRTSRCGTTCARTRSARISAGNDTAWRMNGEQDAAYSALGYALRADLDGRAGALGVRQLAAAAARRDRGRDGTRAGCLAVWRGRPAQHARGAAHGLDRALARRARLLTRSMQASTPRTLTPDGVRAIEAVAREHLERGYHTAAQLARLPRRPPRARPAPRGARARTSDGPRGAHALVLGDQAADRGVRAHTRRARPPRPRPPDRGGVAGVRAGRQGGVHASSRADTSRRLPGVPARTSIGRASATGTR